MRFRSMVALHHNLRARLKLIRSYRRVPAVRKPKPHGHRFELSSRKHIDLLLVGLRRRQARLLQHRGRWPEAQHGVGHFQRVIELSGQDRDVGGHSRKQLEVRIVDRDHHVVGDHVLRDDWRLADVGNDALETSCRSTNRR